MNIGDAGITALFGYAVVFFGLILLMIVVYCMSAFFKSREKAVVPEKSAPVVAEEEKIKEPEKPLPVAPGSAGRIKLFDVPDKEAVMIMAIVADTMKKPLNELHFISIREVK
ncbi:MAG: OadG family protein [Ruminococcus sp.]|nr:OadG family protein [Ruminococcus sp.]